MRFFAILLLLGICVLCHAKEITDTLTSTKNDRVVITYDLIIDNDQVKINFKNVKKRLGATYRNKYREADKVVVVFFDRTGNYKNYAFTGINPETIRIPDNLNYSALSEGYYILRPNQMTTLLAKFSSNSTQVSSLEIPIYLAYYKEKSKGFLGIGKSPSSYELFAACGILKVKFSQKQKKEEGEIVSKSETIVSSSTIDGSFSEIDDKALRLVSSVLSLLEKQTKLPLDEELNSDFSNLKNLSFEVKDERVQARVEMAILAYREKKEELEGKAEMAALRAKEEAARQTFLDSLRRKAEQDSIAAAQIAAEEEQKERNLWMIIGGVILAIAMFVGNQLAQTFRTRRTEKKMSDMAKHAEEEVKRRTQQKINSKLNKAQYDVRRKTREMVNEGINNVKNSKNKKGNKGVTI